MAESAALAFGNGFFQLLQSGLDVLQFCLDQRQWIVILVQFPFQKPSRVIAQADLFLVKLFHFLNQLLVAGCN